MFDMFDYRKEFPEISFNVGLLLRCPTIAKQYSFASDKSVKVIIALNLFIEYLYFKVSRTICAFPFLITLYLIFQYVNS